MSQSFAGEMNHEVTYGHLAAANERCDAGQQAKRNQQPADEFDPGAEYHQRAVRRSVAARWKSEKLLAAMTGEEKADNQPHQTVNGIRTTTKEVHGPYADSAPSCVKT